MPREKAIVPNRRLASYRTFLTTVLLLSIVGCANHLQNGEMSAKFTGNDFYMVIGKVDLYDYNIWGNIRPTGETVEIAVAVQAVKDSGKILRIATLQSKNADGVAGSGGDNYILADLRVGYRLSTSSCFLAGLIPLRRHEMQSPNWAPTPNSR